MLLEVKLMQTGEKDANLKKLCEQFLEVNAKSCLFVVLLFLKTSLSFVNVSSSCFFSSRATSASTAAVI